MKIKTAEVRKAIVAATTLVTGAASVFTLHGTAERVVPTVLMALGAAGVFFARNDMPTVIDTSDVAEDVKIVTGVVGAAAGTVRAVPAVPAAAPVPSPTPSATPPADPAA